MQETIEKSRLLKERITELDLKINDERQARLNISEETGRLRSQGT